MFQSRFLQNFAEILVIDGTARGLFFVEWIALWGNAVILLERGFVLKFSPQGRSTGKLDFTTE